MPAAYPSTVKLWLADRPVAADVTAQAVDLLIGRTAGVVEQRRVRRLFEQFEEVVAERLAPLVEHEFRGVPDHERAAALEAVQATFAEAALTDDDLFAGDLDAGTCTADPDEVLQAVRDRLARHRRRDGELPGRVVLVVCGVLGAGLGYAAASGARWAALRIGGDFAVFAPVLKQIVTVLAPFIGLVPAKLLADRRQARLDPGAVVVVLLAGLITLGALLLALGR